MILNVNFIFIFNYLRYILQIGLSGVIINIILIRMKKLQFFLFVCYQRKKLTFLFIRKTVNETQINSVSESIFIFSLYIYLFDVNLFRRHHTGRAESWKTLKAIRVF